MTTWNTISKPTSQGSITIQAGEPIGLLLALTYSTAEVVPGNNWTFISDPGATSWTTVSKPI